MDHLIRHHELLSSLTLNRDGLVGAERARDREIAVHVHRNHSFELVANTMNSFLCLSGLNAGFVYGDYDDSFGFADLRESSDLDLIWVDVSRYGADAGNFLADRIAYLAQAAKRPILVAPVAGSIDTKDAAVADFALVENLLGDAFFDARLADFTGTRCSPRACLELSRQLGARYVPSVLGLNLKAVVVDLDNTLYRGVLGEDGIDGLVLETGHIALQQHLVSLYRQGYFICVVSKNNQDDVQRLFRARTDFPLKPDFITKTLASWNAKSESIRQLETYLNIHHSSMVFLDDNMGELFEANCALPDLKMLWASPDSDANARALKNFPGLTKTGTSSEDLARSRDVQANETRRRAMSAMSVEDYMKFLEIKLDFATDVPEHLSRVAELSGKTNQFIFNYGRFSAAQVSEAAQSEAATVVTVSMRDKLVDSGIIGCLVAKSDGDVTVIEDLFVSCRALGRGLDEIVVLGALKCAVDRLGKTKLLIKFKNGERNLPARNFVDTHLAAFANVTSEFSYEFPQGMVEITLPL